MDNNTSNVASNTTTPSSNYITQETTELSSQPQLIHLRVLSACNGVVYPITLHSSELS